MTRRFRIVAACVAAAVSGAVTGVATKGPDQDLGTRGAVASPTAEAIDTSELAGQAYDAPVHILASAAGTAPAVGVGVASHQGALPPVPTTALEAFELATSVSPTGCHLQVTLLAAIGYAATAAGNGPVSYVGHRAEPPVYGPAATADGQTVADTDAGRWDADPLRDRRVGPMQLLPESWRVAEVDVDGDGLRDPQNIFDAAGAAMVLLCAGHGDLSRPGALRDAVWAYESSPAFLRAVLAARSRYEQFGMYPEVNPEAARLAAAPEPLPTHRALVARVAPAIKRAQSIATSPTSAPPAVASPAPTSTPSPSPSDPTTPSLPDPSTTPAPSPGQPPTSTTTPVPVPTPTSPQPSTAPPPTPDPTPTPEPSPPTCTPPDTPTPTPDPTDPGTPGTPGPADVPATTVDPAAAPPGTPAATGAPVTASTC
jgi:hypothetical protein